MEKSFCRIRLHELLEAWQETADPTDPLDMQKSCPEFRQIQELLRDYRDEATRYLLELLEEWPRCGIQVMLALEEVTGLKLGRDRTSDVPFWSVAWISWGRDKFDPILDED